MSTHIDFNLFKLRIESCVKFGGEWSGYVYRVSDIDYSEPQNLLSGEGSKENGGRWNGPGSFRAIYFSLSESTAIEESKSKARYHGFEGHTIFPKVISAIHVSLHNVLDLTSGDCRNRLQISLSNITRCDWRKEQQQGREALTQALGRAVCAAEFEGLLVASAADANGTCLVVFPAKLHKDSKINVINEDKYWALKSAGQKPIRK